MDRYEIILSGNGGQGIILAGIVFSTAVALYTDKNVVQSQSYGPEARGGASRAEVIISDSPIYYPKTVIADLLLALTQESLNSYIKLLKEGGLLVIDQEYVSYKAPEKFKVIKLPFTSIARDDMKNPLVTNMLAMGAISGILKIFSEEALCNTVGEKVSPAYKDINIRAIRSGFKLGRQAWRQMK